MTAPGREDERLTTPTHVLDLQQLLKGNPIDPNREERLAHKRANLARHEQMKQNARLNDLHTLYMNAREFIVTPAQLDAAVDEAFGPEDNPVRFQNQQSIWGEGKPASVQDMLNSANGVSGRAVSGAGPLEASRARIKRIAEELTGGKMEETSGA